MNRHCWPALLVLSLAFSPGCGTGSGADMAIIHANLIDVRSGSVLRDRTILIRERRIAAIGPTADLKVPSDTETVDANDGYVIPGLWDMHVHALWDEHIARAFLPLFVASGVVGIRDMGGSLVVRDRMRELRATGGIVSPHFISPGPFVDGIDFYPGLTIVAETASDGRAAAESLAAAGADFLKVYTQLPREAFFALVETARERGLDVVGHVPAEVTPQEASAVGFRSMEHLRDEIEPLCRPRNADDCDTLLQVLRENETWQTPTLVVLRAKASLKDSSIVFDKRQRYVPPPVRAEWTASRESRMGNDPEYFAEKVERFRDEMWLVGKMNDAGVRILAGSDAGSLFSIPGFGLHDELELLVRSGMSRAEALRSATLNAAEFLGIADSVGTIEVGSAAEIVLLRKNPLEDAGNIRSIEAVIWNGSVLNRARLDSILAQAESAAGRMQ